MITSLKENKYLLVFISILNVFILSIGHVLENQIILLFSIAIFVLSICLSDKSNFLPLMLFYLPWQNVLRTGPYSYTFFTLIVPIVFILILLRGIKYEHYYSKDIFVFPLILILYTLVIKFLNNLSLHTEYLFFIFMLVFIPLYINQYKDKLSFERCILFLTLGILSANISAYLLMNNPNMLDYIIVEGAELVGISRFTGFKGDPNFYAMQILTCLAGLYVIISKTTSKKILLF
jgi:hypothetical protein